MILVAERDGEVVGFAAAGPSPDPKVPGSCMPSTSTRPLGRRRRPALLGAAQAELDRMGFAESVLWVLPGNACARRFYERAGWAADGTEKTSEAFGVSFDEVRLPRRSTSEAISSKRPRPGPSSRSRRGSPPGGRGRPPRRERALPSSAVHVRCWSRPTTTTRLPLARDCAACSAWSRHTTTVKKDASWSRRPETATRNTARAMPPSVRRSSGSSVRWPAKLTAASVMVLPISVTWPGGLPCPWTRGTVDTAACQETAGGSDGANEVGHGQDCRPMAGEGAGLVGGVLAAGVGACQHRPARSLHPGRGGRTSSHHEGRSPARSR